MDERVPPASSGTAALVSGYIKQVLYLWVVSLKVVNGVNLAWDRMLECVPSMCQALSSENQAKS